MFFFSWVGGRDLPTLAATPVTVPGSVGMLQKNLEISQKILTTLALLTFFLFLGGGTPCLPSLALLPLSQALWACPQKKIETS